MLSGALTVPPQARAHVVVEPDRAAAIDSPSPFRPATSC
jgi:hypothetical protein